MSNHNSKYFLPPIKGHYDLESGITIFSNGVKNFAVSDEMLEMQRGKEMIRKQVETELKIDMSKYKIIGTPIIETIKGFNRDMLVALKDEMDHTVMPMFERQQENSIGRLLDGKFLFKKTKKDKADDIVKLKDLLNVGAITFNEARERMDLPVIDHCWTGPENIRGFTPRPFVRVRYPYAEILEGPEFKARKLLRRIIGSERISYYVDNQRIFYKGLSGRIYVIRPGHGFTDVFENGQPLFSLCIVFNDPYIPDTDSVIMRLTMLQNDEFNFERKSVKHPLCYGNCNIPENLVINANPILN